MKEKHYKNKKRLRIIPLILGIYGTFLGLGLAVIGLAEIKEGIGIIRLLVGLGMAGFGLLGIWDGVRDLVKPDKKTDQAPVNQFVLTDTHGNRSSLVTPERLREQMNLLVESEEPGRFDIQILPPLSAGKQGLLMQILCVYYGTIIMAAFFEMPKGGYRICQKSMEPDMAVEWMKQLLTGSPDFSEWESLKANTCQDEDDDFQNEEYTQEDKAEDGSDETDTLQEGVEAFWHQLLAGQGVTSCWHQLLVIFGESWHDEHRFFSARDIELAVDGIYEGKYQKAVLEWGTEAFDLFPGIENELMVIWRTNHAGGNTRFLAKEGTASQVKFWLGNYLDHGFSEDRSGWADVTGQIESISAKMEKEERKGKKKHGKVF